MSEEAVKRKVRYAKKKACGILVRTGHKIIPSDNSNFCLLAIRRKEIRMIRVVVDKITPQDIKLVEGFEPPGTCTKEIWLKIEANPDFIIKEVL